MVLSRVKRHSFLYLSWQSIGLMSRRSRVQTSSGTVEYIESVKDDIHAFYYIKKLNHDRGSRGTQSLDAINQFMSVWVSLASRRLLHPPTIKMSGRRADRMMSSARVRFPFLFLYNIHLGCMLYNYYRNKFYRKT